MAQGKPEKLSLRFCDGRTKPGMKMVVTLALILTFSPGEKEQRSHLSGLRIIVRQIQSQVFV